MPHAQDICLTIFLAALVGKRVVWENGLPGLQMLTGGATPQIHLRILGNDPLRGLQLGWGEPVCGQSCKYHASNFLPPLS